MLNLDPGFIHRKPVPLAKLALVTKFLIFSLNFIQIESDQSQKVLRVSMHHVSRHFSPILYNNFIKYHY